MHGHLVPERPPWCPSAPGSRCGAPTTTWSLIPSLGYAGGRLCRRGDARWSRCHRTTVSARSHPTRRSRQLHVAEGRVGSPLTSPSRGGRIDGAAARLPPGPGVAEPRRSAARGGSRRSGPGVGDLDRSRGHAGRPWRSVLRPPSTGRRRRPPVSAARTRARTCPPAVLGHEVVVGNGRWG